MSTQATYLDHVQLIEGQSGQDVLAAIRDQKAQVEQGLHARGAVLLRGFSAPDPNTASEALRTFGDELLDDAFWSTPRSGVSAKTFTATEYPKARTIALHSEMAYMAAWPRLLAFHSIDVADEGGETTIASLDDVSAELGSTLEAFGTKGITYRRTYHPGIDIPWQKAFRTEDEKEVEAVAARTGMKASWLPGGVLQTAHTAQGCVKAEDGRWLWFNQSHVFHQSNLPQEHRKMLTEMFGADQLPRDAVYGDGSPIAGETVKAIHETLTRHTLGVKWQPGDVLLLDNMRYMHGRLPFKGTRKLHVALANQHAQPLRTPPFA